MGIYLSEQTIEEAYISLTNNVNKYETVIFTLLILKHAGITKHDYINLKDENTRLDLFNATKQLAYLFISEDYKKERKNFINPLTMSTWKNNPSESLYMWSPSRLVNNVLGGGRQWSNIILNDPNDNNSIKLKHDYLDYFEGIDDKIPVDSLSVWLVRFNQFEQEMPLSKIFTNFYEYFNIDEAEKLHFFTNTKSIHLNYQNERISPHFIRSLIATKDEESEWLDEFSDVKEIHVTDDNSFVKFSNSSFDTMYGTSFETEYYEKVLHNGKQLIFMGPPGTSKSYQAKLISKHFDVVKRIQFHPQYSYQDFIGGKILEQGNLVDQKGELINLIERAQKDEDREFLLIIEEINRANVSQVFGEMIQLLDRGESLELSFNDITKEYYLPDNLKIIGTMNTTDRTVGRIDYAIKRRFFQIYFKPEIDILVEKVKIENNDFSIADLMMKINQNLYDTLNNKEMVIGHAIFLKDYTYDNDKRQFIWSLQDFEQLFYYVIVPLIEDYCNGNLDLTISILGEKLYHRQTGSELLTLLKEFSS